MTTQGIFKRHCEGTVHNPFLSLHRQQLSTIIRMRQDKKEKTNPKLKNTLFESQVLLFKKVQVKAKDILFVFLFCE